MSDPAPATKSRLRILSGAVLAAICLCGFLIWWANSAKLDGVGRQPAKMGVKATPVIPVPASVPPVRDEFDWSIPAEHLDSQGRIVFAPTAVKEMEISKELVAEIPWQEKYTPVPLANVGVKDTEDQFQEDRANWYQNHFIREYERAGHRDPKWDNLAQTFLKEAAQRVSITRYRGHRSPKFYPDHFDDDLMTQGLEIEKLGCQDPLVLALLVEEAERLESHLEKKRLANQLSSRVGNTDYSEFIQYQLARACWSSDRRHESREPMVKHLLRALDQWTQMTDLERRIVYEEAQTIFLPVYESELSKFIVWLKDNEGADDWLQDMLLADFYYELAMNAGMLRTHWPSYDIVYARSMENARSVHMGHLRKSYRLYLQALRERPTLPETPWKLFRMSFRQSPALTSLMGQTEEEEGLDRLSPASPRYWFDRVVAIQFDYRPMYRQYRSALLPPNWNANNWSQYQSLLEFGAECLRTERFDTQVPFGFPEAVEAIVRNDEYSIPPPSSRSLTVYAFDNMTEGFEKLSDGYTDRLSPEQRRYYDTLLLGIRWLDGERDDMKSQLAGLTSEADQRAFRDLFLRKSEMLRELQSGLNATPTIPIDGVYSVTFIGDTRTLLLDLGNGRFQTWNADSLTLLKEHALYEDTDDAPVAGAVSDRGGFIACYQEPHLTVFETESFAPIATMEVEGTVHGFFVSRTGQVVAIDRDGSVEFWKVGPRELIGKIDITLEPGTYVGEKWRQIQQPVTRMVFSADDELVAFVRGRAVTKLPMQFDRSVDTPEWPVNRLYVWDLANAKLLGTSELFNPNITAIQFADATSDLLVAGTKWRFEKSTREPDEEIVERYSIARLDGRSLKVKAQYVGRTRPFWNVAEFGHDRSQVIAMELGELFVWNADSGEEITTAELHAGVGQFMVPSQAMGLVLTIDTSGSVKSLPDNFTSGIRPVLAEIDSYQNFAPHTVRFHHSKSLIGVCNEHTGAVVWDLSNEDNARGRAYRLSGAVGTTALDISRDFSRLAAVEDTLAEEKVQTLPEAKPVLLWDVSRGHVTRRLTGTTSIARCARFDPSGRFLFAGLEDGNIVIWDIESDSNEPAKTIKEHVASVTRLEFSPDGQMLCSGGQSGEAFGKKIPASVKLWNVADPAAPQSIRTLDINRRTKHPFGVQDIDVSTDRQLILATYGFETSLFGSDGELKCNVQGNKARFLPDQSGFLTAGGTRLNKKIAQWRFDGSKVREFDEETLRGINSLVIGPKNRTAIAIPYSAAITAWDIESGSRLPTAAAVFD